MGWLRIRKRGHSFWEVKDAPSARWRWLPTVYGDPDDLAEGYYVSYLQRRGKGEVAKTPATERFMQEDREAYPALLEFLTASSWPDGTDRRPGTLLVFFDEGKLKVCLSDRDQDQVLFCTVGGLFVALEAVDDALRVENADWRPAKNNRTRR